MIRMKIIIERAPINQMLCFISGLQIAQALQLQMEVQRKLHEQIEVGPLKPILFSVVSFIITLDLSIYPIKSYYF